MADESFIEKKSDDEARNIGISYKIRRIGFPIAVVLCLLLLIVCIVLAVLYSKEVKKTKVTPEETKYETCDDQRCFRIAMELVKNMDKNVDPCKDFYAYACQGWEKNNPAKNGSDKPVTRVPLLGEDDLISLKKAIESPSTNYSQNAVLKTIRFYNSCINVTAINALGMQSVKDLVQEYGGWSVFSNIDPSVSLTTRIGKVLRELYVETLFDIEVAIDPLNRTRRALELAKPTIGLGSAFHSKANSSSKEHLTYINLLKTAGRVFTGLNSSDDKMMAIYDFEMSIAKIFREGHEKTSRRMASFWGNRRRQKRSHISSQESHMSLLTFCNATGIPWPFFQKILTIVLARDFSGNENISLSYMTSIESFKKTYLLIKNTNETVVSDYIMWQVIRKYAQVIPALYSSYQKTVNDTGATKKPRWKQCIYYMSTPFDMTLGLLYVDFVIKNDPKKKLEVMFENIRSSFIDRLQRDSWMDSRTKENAKQKALAMKANIAYPPNIKNPSKLEKRYESLKITDNFFKNFKAISHFRAMEYFGSYDLPVVRNEWTLTNLYEMNAYYSEISNKIVIFAAIIQPPFYSTEYPMYMVYGGIGMVIAHEITHGFDGSGRKYDSVGRKQDWWSKSSSESFEQRADCFKSQYDKYTVFGKNLNGSVTLDENISDNGGISLAYEAYQRWRKENGEEKILPGLDLSPDQLFFLGFSQMWCGSYNAASAEEEMKHDFTHSFPKYRVIGPLSNFKPFAEAFNCPANSPMNPSNKCVIW